MAEFLFWTCLLLPAYAWLGYPLVLRVLGTFISRPVRSGNSALSVSIIIAAHNEAAHIQSKIRSLLGQGYPASALEVLVASDGSSDDTVALAEAVGDARVRALDLPRMGKTRALNVAVAEARYEVLVFTDADNVWTAETLNHLLAPLADPTVGCCGGTLVVHRSGSSLSIGDRWYRRYEAWLRELENRVGCMVSADGALLALRRELWQPIPDEVNDDFFLSTCAPVQGQRIVHVPGAVVLDHGLAEADKQLHRRIRVTVGGLQSLLVRRQLLNPLRYGAYALALISHKVLRRFAPLLLVPLLLANLALWDAGPLYRFSLLLQLTGYAVGLAGLFDRSDRLPRAFRLAGFLLVTLVGMAVGLVQFIRGRRYSLWNPQQSR